MLLEQVKNPVEMRGMMAVATATIKATPKIFNFFADQTYSNKPLAICRELVANAIDAHTAAGCPDRPVEVWLPTEFDPVFKVRDYGIGMSHEFMTTSFLAYTDGSTKDSSNDQIGGFGIGSKSPFAYTDQYTLRVVHDGILSIYSMFKNEDGIPAIGLLSQGPTDEGNGVEVSFPVKTEDFATFAKAAQTALCYFDPLPLVYGGELTPPKYVAQGKTWGMRETAGNLNIIMGGVCYPVQNYNLPYELLYESDLRHLLTFGLDIKLPIGACGVALSREGLSYDNRTSDAIGQALEDLYEEITKSFSTMFDGYETEYEAMEALNREISETSGGRSDFLQNKAFYRGRALSVGFDPDAITWRIEKRSARRRGSKTVNPRWVDEYGALQMFRPGAYEEIIIDDLPRSPTSKTVLRIQNFVEYLPCARDIMVLRPHHDETADDLIEKLRGIPRDRYVLTSELPVPAKAARTRGQRPKVRMFEICHGQPSRKLKVGDLAVREQQDYLRDNSGILVTMDQFEIPDKVFQYAGAGLLDWRELRFVNKSDAAKLKSEKWEDYAQVAERRLKEILFANPNLPVGLGLLNNYEFFQIFQVAADLVHFKFTAAQEARPFGRIMKIYREYILPIKPEHKPLANLLPFKAPPRVNVEKLLQNFRDQQPRAARLLSLTRNNLRGDDREFFMELI